MDYRLYRNLTRYLEPYQPGDTLWFDETRFVLPDAYTDAGAGNQLTKVFIDHNRSDRSDGTYAPALTTGDVIALDFDSGAPRWWTVAGRWFDSLESGPYLCDVICSSNSSWRDARSTQLLTH